MANVFIPNGNKYLFPGQCANCLGPATTTNQLKLSKQLQTQDDRILERKIITNTYTIERTMRIPYCSSCSEHAQQLRKVIGRVNLIAAILGVEYCAEFTYHPPITAVHEVNAVIDRVHLFPLCTPGLTAI